MVIERVFSTYVQDCYGLGEGLQVGAQCACVQSLHINQANVVVEITDPSGQRDRLSGELGKLLVTRLSLGPMPLIRYDTGDLSSFTENECRCGRKLESLSKIYGRDTDIIVSPLGDKLIVHFFTQIFEMTPEISQFQIRQNNIEEIDIYYVSDKNCNDRLLDQIENQIHDKCKYKFRINFKRKRDIPLLSSNKRRFIISNLSPELKF